MIQDFKKTYTFNLFIITTMTFKSSYHHHQPKIGTFLFLLLFFIISLNSQSQRPNIIYIMADDLGYADLSCYGRKDYTTPNLDKLASEGIKFTNAYSGAALCTPTRVAFMTGRYPARTPVGLMEPLRGGPKDSLIGLKPEYTSVATLVRGAGYETALIGKWHLGYLPENSPTANGFNHFFGFHSGATDYVTHKQRSGKPDLYENEKPVKKDGYITDLITERAVQYIRKRHSSPFFLSIQFNAPHWP
ncbi:MAG: sulfatase-like hydrolase/transferase, partial [Flavitalea sp.]